MQSSHEVMSPNKQCVWPRGGVVRQQQKGPGGLEINSLRLAGHGPVQPLEAGRKIAFTLSCRPVLWGSLDVK